MKYIFSIFIIFFLVNGYCETNKQKDIYLLIGQSNMAGRAPVLKQDMLEIKNCFLLDNQSIWIPAKNPLNIYSSIRGPKTSQKLGPGYSFCKHLTNIYKNKEVGLIVNAKGGTKIEEWLKGKKFYNEIIFRAKSAQGGKIKGILWHQGESNIDEPSEYFVNLKKLIFDLRTDLKNEKLPFIAGEINNAPMLNAQIRKLSTEIAYSSYVSSIDLNTFDQWHFDNPSINKLGKRYALEMIKLLNNY